MRILAAFLIIAIIYAPACHASGADASPSFDNMTAKEQADYLNIRIKELNLSWVASETTVSMLPLDQRMHLVGALPAQSPDDYAAGAPSMSPMAGSSPDFLDWRNRSGKNWITSIKSQGGCGSCWAFAAVGVLESRINIDLNNSTYGANLSEQQLISCSGAGTCSGGWEYDALRYANSTGVAKEECFPYAASNLACTIATTCPTWQNHVLKAAYRSNVGGSSVSIKQAIDDFGPVTAAMYAYADFASYGGGVYSHVLATPFGYHAVDIVGYNDTGGYWIVKNEWGTGWGEQGFARISYTENTNEAGWQIGNPGCLFIDRVYSVASTDITVPPQLSGAQANATAAKSSANITFTISAVPASIKALASVRLNGAAMSGPLYEGGNFTLSAPLSSFGCIGSGNCTLYANATDDAGISSVAAMPAIALQDVVPQVSAWVSDPDMFYSPSAGNNVIHLLANVSNNDNASAVVANFTNISSCGGSGIVNMSYNPGTMLYEANCTATANASVSNFAQGYVKVSATSIDLLQNYSIVSPVVLYNMTLPQGDAQGCMQFAPGTTNMSRELDFNSVNFTLVVARNGSAACNGRLLWGNSVRTVAAMSFFSLNMTGGAIGQELSGLASAINVTVAPPRAFGVSRVYMNASAFPELNSTANLTFCNLPFTSQPSVLGDAGPGAAIGGWAPWFDAAMNASLGNLTLMVSHFSGYNATDAAAPTLAVSSPAGHANSSTSLWFNFTLNGTGSEPSYASLAAYNASNLSQQMFAPIAYNASGGGSLSCANTTQGGEAVACSRLLMLGTGGANLPNGNYVATISAWDFGWPQGNQANASISFTLDNVTPAVALLSPGNNTNWSSPVPIIFTVADIPPTVTCTAFEDGAAVANSTGAYLANGSVDGAGSIAPPDGRHTLRINCTDGAGLSGNSSTASYTYDTTPPALQANSPADGFASPSSSPMLNWTATDALRTGITCGIYINGAASRQGMAVQNGTAYANTTASPLADGAYSWQVNCSDDLNNSNATAARAIIIDAVAPALAVLSPQSNTVSGSNSTTISYTVAEPALNMTNVTFLNASSGQYVASFSNSSNGSVQFQAGVADGVYNITFISYSPLWASQANVTNFTVDSTPPAVALASPASAVYANATVQVNFTQSDLTPPSACWYSIDGGASVALPGCANGTAGALLDGMHTIRLFVNDSAGNVGWAFRTFATDISNSTMDGSAGAIAFGNSSATTAFVPSGASPQNVTIPSSVAPNATISLAFANLTLNASNSSQTYFMFNATLNVTRNTTEGIYRLEIPANTTVSGPANWTGTMELPTILPPSTISPPADSGFSSATAQVAVEVGFGGSALYFDTPVRMLLPGMAGKYAGYSRAGSFTAIISGCASDTPSGMPSGAQECKLDSGTGMVIWTRHFTAFVAYSQTPAPSPPSPSGGSSSGGGGGGSGASSSRQTSRYMVGMGSGADCPILVSREMKSSQNRSELVTTLENVGENSTCNLEDFTFADTLPKGIFAINATTFNPQFDSEANGTVAFAFPSFSEGESKTFSYSVAAWVSPARAKNFTVYSMSAKKRPSAQAGDGTGAQQAGGQNMTQANATAGGKANSTRPPAPAAQAQPSAPAPSGPQEGVGWLFLGALAAVAAALIAYFLRARMKGKGDASAGGKLAQPGSPDGKQGAKPKGGRH